MPFVDIGRPDSHALIGMVLIATAGIVTTWREQKAAGTRATKS